MQKEISDILERLREDKTGYSVVKAEFDAKLNNIDNLYKLNLERQQKKVTDEVKYMQTNIEKFTNKIQPKVDIIATLEKRIKEQDSAFAEIENTIKTNGK